MISDSDILSYTRAHTDDLPTLRRLERAAVAQVEAKTGYQWRLDEDVIETVTRRGDVISLSGVPADGLLDSLESWDGTAWSALETSAYYVDGSHITLQVNGFPSSTSPFPTRFRATYPGGYAQGEDVNELVVPENVSQAVRMYVAYWFDNRDGLDYEQLERAVNAILSTVTRQAV